MEPPSAPPPPPPPLNIPPSRARRQLAARLALHSKQNQENAGNGEQAEKPSPRKQDLNPFAADEDDDSDNDGDFTIGDLEADEEGRGHLPTGTGLVGSEEPILEAGKNVGVLPNAIVLPSNNHKALRASFPSMWPFGGGVPNKGTNDFAVGDGSPDYNRNHLRGASADNNHLQSSDDSEDSDDESYDHHRGFGIDGVRSGKRRLSVTTEAKRRTSLEDDDEDEEVVHVAMVEPETLKETFPESEKASHGDGDDGELVEIRHAEMQGVEAQKTK
jgi:hypothetical protein